MFAKAGPEICFCRGPAQRIVAAAHHVAGGLCVTATLGRLGHVSGCLLDAVIEFNPYAVKGFFNLLLKGGHMKEFLSLVVKNGDGYSGLVPELDVMAVGDTEEAVKKLLSEGIALKLAEDSEITPSARKLADLPEEVQADYANFDLTEVLLKPAEMNPTSRQIEQAIKASGLSEREIARRMGTGHAAIHRLTDPFYWGQTVKTLRSLGAILNLSLDMQFVKPIELPSGSILAYHWGGMEIGPQARVVKDLPELQNVPLPVVVSTPDFGAVHLSEVCEEMWQTDSGSLMYYAHRVK